MRTAGSDRVHDGAEPLGALARTTEHEEAQVAILAAHLEAAGPC